MKGNDAGCEAATCYRQYHQQLSCVEEAEDEGADEAGTAEQYHRNDVELLRSYLGINLCHTFLHQNAGTILDDEGPAHNLCAHIEELGEYAFTIVRHAEDAAKGRHEVDLVVLLAVLRHLGKQDDEEDGEDKIVIRPMMNIQLSVDHRLIDGLLASQFVEYMKELLENPLKILL